MNNNTIAPKIKTIAERFRCGAVQYKASEVFANSPKVPTDPFKTLLIEPNGEFSYYNRTGRWLSLSDPFYIINVNGEYQLHYSE